MKKLASILLLFLLLHNMVGYYVFVAWKHIEVKNELKNFIENDKINDRELLVFKVPVNLFYQDNRPNFERVEGEFVFEGKVYEMVKQKLVNGVMHVYCYNNHKKEQLNSELSEHNQNNFSDFKGKPLEKNAKIVLDFLKDYLPYAPKYSFYLYKIILKKEFITYLNPIFCSLTSKTAVPPPDVV